jgi:hypothetical protein
MEPLPGPKEAGVPDTGEIQQLLADLHASRKEVRAEAARRLGMVGTRAVPFLLEALRDEDWVVRYRAAEALSLITDPQVDPALITALDDKRDHVRYMAAKGLGTRRTSAALVPLIRSLGDENEFVRMCVARALAMLGEPDAGKALQERIGAEPVKRVAEEMKRALLRLGQY